MYYILAPTNNDIIHGKVWKSHKYISRVWSKGKWVYTYTKNRAKGNKVTNKDGKAYTPEYTTNINRAKMLPLNDPERKHESKYTFGPGKKVTNQNTRLANLYNNGSYETIQYSPTIKSHGGSTYEPINKKYEDKYDTIDYREGKKKSGKYGKMKRR